MSILIDENTRVIVQGITGRAGSLHTRRMLNAGTKIVAGVTPGKGGASVEGIMVYQSVDEAAAAEEANVSIIFVPPPMAADAILEAFEAEIELVVCITEGIPILDMIRLKSLTSGAGTRLLGPNCSGVISPGESMVGIMPVDIFNPGNIGVLSKSGTLTYEVIEAMRMAGLGQSTCVGIGGDPVHGLSMVDCLEFFERDPSTERIVLIGEIGGREEEEAAIFYSEAMTKPMVALVTGRSAPSERRMGHAGAIVSMGFGIAEHKIRMLSEAGVKICDSVMDVPDMILRAKGRH